MILILTACGTSQRAGSLYKPETYQSFNISQKAPERLDAASVPYYSYHSALGSYCTQYQAQDRLQMRCDNGQNKKIVPVL